jgi:hypothetical protein
MMVHGLSTYERRTQFFLQDYFAELCSESPSPAFSRGRGGFRAAQSFRFSVQRLIIMMPAK